MRIERATIEDVVEILALQKLAYRSEAELYDDYEIQPMTQTLESVESEFRDHVFLKAVEDGGIVGSVRAGERDGACHIGKLIVAPVWQGQGIGASLMREIESLFSDAERFILFTGHRSEGNLRLYRRLGYVEFERREMGDIEMVFMEKRSS